MFDLRKSLRENYIKAVGNWADYDIFLKAAGWLKIGILTEEDLAEIQAAIDAQNPSAPAFGEGVAANG